VDTREYNEIMATIARRDALRRLAALSQMDRMHDLVRALVECGVLPPGTTPLKPSILHPDD
jgi:hypothetical protein